MNRFICSLGLAGSVLIATGALAEAAPGEPAPAFRATDAAGQPHTLTDYIGGWIVLEWFHPGCEEVTRHYENGDIQALQEEFREEGVEWLTIVSSKAGPENVLEADEALELAETYELAASAPFLLDDTGVVALAYGVKTVPEFFVINRQGGLVYSGALASPDSDLEDNYVRAALEASMRDEEVETPHTKAYGCEIN